jgi:hypothetical protein
MVFTRLVRGLRLSSWPWGLIGMIALSVPVERFVVRHDDRFSTSAPRDWHQTREHAETGLLHSRVLGFGSSHIKTSVVPQVFEAEAGLRTYNLAVIGGQAPSSYFLLRRALAAGARPSAIVVDFLPPLLAINHERNVRQWPEVLSFAECADFAWTSRDASLFASLALEKLLPSFKSRFEIRSAVVDALKGKTPPHGEDLYYRRNWTVNRGAMLLPPYNYEQEAANWYEKNYPAPWTCNRVNADYCRRFLDLAASRGIPVFWLQHPIEAETQKLCEQKGQHERVQRFIRAVVLRYPNVVVIDGLHSGYKKSAFIDPVHLHSHAALILSSDLSRLIRLKLGGRFPKERWLMLPPYEERNIAVAKEHLLESRLALMLAGVKMTDAKKE